MRLRCPFLLLLSSLVPLKSLSDSIIEPSDTLITLSELSVSAFKTGRMLDNEPVAASVLGMNDIKELGLLNIKQVSDISPNLYIPDYGSRITSSIYVRGFGSRIDQPVIGISYDNIPILNKNNFDFDIQNLERVEIIRGAQSTLYGRNTMMGVMNLYTLSPANYQGWKGKVGYGSNNTWRASLGWYGMTKKGLGIGVSAEGGGTRGYWRNMYTGNLTGKEIFGSARLKLTWQSPDGWRLNNSLNVNYTRQDGYPYESLESGTVAYNDSCYYHRFGILEGLTVNKSFDCNMKMSSVTSLQYLDDNMTLDQDFMPVDYFTLTQKIREFGVTQDVTLSNIRPISGYSWLAGAFLWMRDGKMDAPVTFKDYGITHLIEHYRNEANPYYPIQWDERRFVITSNFKPFSWGASLYHESRYTTGRWSFTAGLRFDYEKTELDYRSVINSSYTTYEAATGDVYMNSKVNIDDSGVLHKTFFEILPKFTILYRYGRSENQNIYLNIAKGYKSGGFNTQMFSDVMQQRLRKSLGLSMQYSIDDIVSYNPEKSWTFELGFHSSFLSDNLTISGDVFYITCSDQQVTMFPSGTTTGRIMANAGRSRSYGLEISSAWNIDSHWSATAAFGLAEARFVKFNNGMNDYSGRHIPYAPLTTQYIGINYTSLLKNLKIWFDRVDLSVNAKGTGPIWWNEDNTVKEKWFPLLNASLRLYKGNWSIEGRVENITSTKYSTFYFESIGHRFVQRGLPLRAGFSVAYAL